MAVLGNFEFLNLLIVIIDQSAWLNINTFLTEDGKTEATKQNHKDSTDVDHVERGSFRAV